MGRLNRAATVLEAAERWKQTCLVEGASLFGEEALWTREHLEELQQHNTDHPPEGRGKFDNMAETLFEKVSPEALRLTAEIIWLHGLILSRTTGTNKRDRIKTVYEHSGKDLQEDNWALGGVLDDGVVALLPFYWASPWYDFRDIVSMMYRCRSLSASELSSLLGNPWQFAEELDELFNGRKTQIRHALLFLMFPDEFEPVLTVDQKKEIVKAYSSRADTSYVESLGLVELDKALLEVRTGLETEGHPPGRIDFFQSPFKEKWEIITEKGSTKDELWYRDRLGNAQTWLISLYQYTDDMWQICLDQGFMFIPWGGIGDLGEFNSKEDIYNALKTTYEEFTNPGSRASAAWNFNRKMKIGDIVIAVKEGNLLYGWGTVTGEYFYDEQEMSDWRHIRQVDWNKCSEPIDIGKRIIGRRLKEITQQKDIVRRAFEAIDSTTGGNGTRPIEQIDNDNYDIDTALKDLFLDENQFERIIAAIKFRKNLILQGPPGVGKTFIAHRIAWCLIGRKKSQNVELVQFHQSYAYEDFVQGWRPSETGGFTLRNGVFFEFCKRAEKDPEIPYVFIIDEINRGNLSRIFGELLMLIEADKRSTDYAVALTYADQGERFHVPDNVYILGMMNTADRSLAIVDYALRRRFAFERLNPAFRTTKFREHMRRAGVEPALVNRIVKNMSLINEKIRNDKDLGRGFQIGHSYFVPKYGTDSDDQWYENILDTQIEPLLQEYWSDRFDEVEQLLSQLQQ